jgi:hypothetical protein
MSICTVCDQPSNDSIKLPKYVRDKRAAYVENVCRILIESRMGPAAVWIDAEEPPLPVPDPFAADAPLLDFRSRFSLVREALSPFRRIGRHGMSRFKLLRDWFPGKWLGGFRGLPALLAQRISASCLPRGSPSDAALSRSLVHLRASVSGYRIAVGFSQRVRLFPHTLLG